MNEIHPSLWRSFKDLSYQLMTQFIDLSSAAKQVVDGQSQQYVLTSASR